MDTVRPRRMSALRELLVALGVNPTEGRLDHAYKLGFEAYMAAWKKGLHFGAPNQVFLILKHFGIDPDSVDQDLIDQTVTAVEEASLRAPLQLLPGVRETIPALSEAGYRLGLVSDTSLTPGRVLERFLQKDGLLDCFSALTYSDVTGYTKPDPRMFEGTLTALDASATEAIHVGDTPRTDIAGAKALGMVTIRCAGAVDHLDPPAADHVIRDHREIPAILDQLSRDKLT